MEFRNLFAVAAIACLVPFLVSCEDDATSAPDASSDKVKETVRDSVVVRDSIVIRDSVIIRDSVVYRDSVRLVDSVKYVDSVRVVDSLDIKDSVHSADSVHVQDTARVADSLQVGDSIAVVEPVTAFVPLKSVFEDLAEGEKVVAVLRHAERGDDHSSTGPLNDNGVEQALSLGESLRGGSDIYFAASPATRTHQTCSNIAKGMGLSDTLADTLEFLGGTWFVKDTAKYSEYKNDHGGSWKVTSRWLYEGRYADAFYELAPRTAEYLDDNIIPAFERSGKSMGILISHDLLIIPVVAYYSDNSIDMNYYTSRKWLNYLAGFAVVLKPDGTRKFYAVKGLDAGTMKKE